MGVEFVVETRTLSDLSGQLRTIKDGLDGIENMVEGYGEATGSECVADRLRAFGENWSDRREEISEQLEAVSSYAGAAADAYSSTDGDLTASFRDAGGREAGHLVYAVRTARSAPGWRPASRSRPAVVAASAGR